MEEKPITRTRQEVRNIKIDSGITKDEVTSMIDDNNINYVLPIEDELNTKIDDINNIISLNNDFKENLSTNTIYLNTPFSEYKIYVSYNSSNFPSLCIPSKNMYDAISFDDGYIKYFSETFGGFFIGIEKGLFNITAITRGNPILKYNKNNVFYESNVYSHLITLSDSTNTDVKFKIPSTTTTTQINTYDLLVNYINQIKDIVGWNLTDGIVTPFVLTYEDSTLKLNGATLDSTNLTITDEVTQLTF